MTREDAIKTLKELWRETNDPWYEEAYNMAINALEADRKTEQTKRKGRVMTLDEAIKHCEDVAEDRCGCVEDCVNEHRQLAEWLKELRERRAKDEPQTCDTCKYGEDKHRYAHICNECGVGINNYEPKTEPKTYITEDRDTQILDAWQVHHRSTTSVEDTPQTERNK